MVAKRQICFKVPEVFFKQINKKVEDEGWGTLSEFCSEVIEKYINRDEMIEQQRIATLEALESEAGISLVKRIMDRELLRRAVGDIDPNRAD